MKMKNVLQVYEVLKNDGTSGLPQFIHQHMCHWLLLKNDLYKEQNHGHCCALNSLF